MDITAIAEPATRAEVRLVGAPEDATEVAIRLRCGDGRTVAHLYATAPELRLLRAATAEGLRLLSAEFPVEHPANPGEVGAP